MIEPPADLGFTIDKKYQGKVFDPTNKEHLTEEILNRYITLMMIIYRKSYREGEDLWYTFREDFKNVTINILGIAYRTCHEPKLNPMESDQYA